MAKRSVNGKKLVIVESPTKAKTIRKFLGNDFVVESCMGHIRDLPQSAKDIPLKYKKEAWAKLGVNVEQGFDPLYCIPKSKIKIVKGLKDKLAEASELILATDEDREGESISWHLVEVLKPKVPIKRMVFHEITKEAVDEALNKFRDIDYNLVKAQEARRILDRLVGYTLSPLLWKKVAYGLSAGRVQSVAVSMITERERDRIRFKKASYSGCTSLLEKEGVEFESKLVSTKGKKIATGKDFDGLTGELYPDRDVLLLDQLQADQITEEVKLKSWVVKEVEQKLIMRKPAPPFITSTLQQESNRKLGLSSRETMQIAQKLYEQGYITYMRTDSTFLSEQAVVAARNCIQSRYGKEYLPSERRSYSGKKVKGAQEAHEAIRPAGKQFVAPDESGLEGMLFKVYDLIWKRTIASQMEDSRHNQVSVKFQFKEYIFSSSGMTIEFPGFLRAYVEGSDDPEMDLLDREIRLPKLKEGEAVKNRQAQTVCHETKPPARFTEASLVQTMEKAGIGRPSTYAVVIGTIMDRGYVRKQNNALVPTFTAMVVSNLLVKYLSKFVDVEFTSNMEKSLDVIADGELDTVEYLNRVYHGKEGLLNQVEMKSDEIDPDKARSIYLEGLSDFVFRIGRYGAYVCKRVNGDEICASLPDAQSPSDMTEEIASKLIDQKISGADALGEDPKTGFSVYVLNGRYGPYVQLGESDAEKEKPKRMAIPSFLQPEEVTMKEALELLSLPKSIGTHPDTQKDVKVGLGRFGPYVVHDGDYRSIPKVENLFDVDLERALDLLAQPKKARGRRASPLATLGKFPDTEEEIQMMNGPYGVYVKCGKVNVSLPEGVKSEDVTLELALKLLNEKGGKEVILKKKKSGKTKKENAIKKTKKVEKALKASKKTKKKKKKAVAKKKAVTKKKKVKSKNTTDAKVTKKSRNNESKTVSRKKVIRRSASLGL